MALGGGNFEEVIRSWGRSPHEWDCCAMLSRFSHVQLFATLWTLAHQTPAPEILQARILEWVSMPSSRGSSWPRDRNHVSCASCITGRFSLPLSHQESPEKCPYKRDFRELPVPSIMWGHSKGMAIYEPGHGLSSDTESAGTLILDFPTSRTVNNKLMLLKPPTLLDFCYSNQTKTRTLMEKLIKLKSSLGLG